MYTHWCHCVPLPKGVLFGHRKKSKRRGIREVSEAGTKCLTLGYPLPFYFCSKGLRPSPPWPQFADPLLVQKPCVFTVLGRDLCVLAGPTFPLRPRHMLATEPIFFIVVPNVSGLCCPPCAACGAKAFHYATRHMLFAGLSACMMLPTLCCS